MKKNLAVLLSIILIIGVLPIGALTASAATSGYYTYTVSNGEATITDYEPSVRGPIEIPSELGGYPVTAIGNSAFSYCYYINRITIPDSVTHIGAMAFNSCTALTKITIPDSVTYIGGSAFDSCTSLTSIAIPDSVTFIGELALYECTSLTNINVSPDNQYFTDIAGVLFNKVNNVLICYPAGKTATTYTIPHGVTYIGVSAFNFCTSLVSVTIPDNVISIGAKAFYSCDNLTSVTIPDSVTSIGAEAFYSCDNLTSVTIGKNVTSIGGRAFASGVKLTNITVSPDNLYYTDTDGVLINKVNNVLVCYPAGKTATTYTTPLWVTSIGEWAFYNSTSLKSITIRDSVTCIGKCAFSYCSKLDNITIRNGITTIGDSAFDNCTSLTSVTIGMAVTSIGDWAFYNCTSLKSIIIPDNVTSIGAEAFYSCDNLTSVTIGSGVTSIGDWAFHDCPKLTNIIIDDNADITYIGDQAFYNTGYYNSWANYENDALYIGKHLIAYRGRAIHYTIKSGTKTIAGNAFKECGYELTSIAIPDSVTSIGESAFIGAEGLDSILVSPDNPYYTDIGGVLFNKDKTKIICFPIGYPPVHDEISITIPDFVTEIGEYAFQYCYKLTSVTIGNNVTSIGDWAFRHCENLTSVIIGDSVTSIGTQAFYYCTSLTNVTIGNGVTSLGDYTFDRCTSLKRVYYRGTESNKANIIDNSWDSSLINANWYYNSCIGSATHTYGNACDPNCNVCYDVREIPSHIYDNACDTECNECGYLRQVGNHVYENICDVDCNICGVVREVGEHIYNNDCDTNCNECGALREVPEHIYTYICDNECNICKEVRETEHSYVNGKCEWCNSYIESKHNYVEESEETWAITKENVSSITITFSSDTFVEEDWDFIYIYDRNDKIVGEYTGSQLASKSVTVLGNTAKITLYSDKINTYYGFKVTNIEFDCIHNYTAETKKVSCTENGYTKHTCEHCGDVYYTDEISALGHNYIENVKEPICIEGGYTSRTCETCGDTYTYNYTNPTAIHVYENGNCIGCNAYLESSHNYTDLFDETWEIYRKGATSITLTFSAETFVEENYDFIYIYDAADNEIGKYTGNELSSKAITISGDTVKIKLSSDRVNTAYGFKLTDISADYNIGDLNGDGIVDVRDLVRLKKILAGIDKSEGGSADVNNDGETNSLDLNILRKFILGIVTEIK